MTQNVSAPIDLDKQPTFLGHPVGLYICFLTEMWERFSFYGMKFLLVLYLTKYHLFTDSMGLDVLGNYAGLVYALPLIGGMLADRYLGMRKAVIFGGICLSLGHLGLAWEGAEAVRDVAGVVTRDDAALQVFYFSLALIILGVGFLKPNISTIVGRLYPVGDPRRDSGFTIFYMGINLGSALATTFCGYLGENYGWKYGFGLAGIGMLFGLCIFSYGQRFLYGHAEPSNPAILKERVAGISKEYVIYIVSVVSLLLWWFVVQKHAIVHGVLLYGSIGFLIWLVWFCATQCDKEERGRMLVLTALTSFTVVFWALFEQSAGSMTLFADRVMLRPGTTTASNFGTLNSAFIILLAPLFAWLWIFLAKRKLEPSTPLKFGFGIVLVGLGFGALVYGAHVAGEGKVHWIWMVIAYFCHSSGELCVSPVGLSAVTKLSVPRVVGVMMGAWFLATAASEFVAAGLSKIAAIDTTSPEAMDLAAQLATYTGLFTKLLYVGCGCGIFVIILTPWLRKHMHGIH